MAPSHNESLSVDRFSPALLSIMLQIYCLTSESVIALNKCYSAEVDVN